MAVRRKKTVKKLKFELTRSAAAGVAVIAFCLFLWMFLLGVWAGQSLLVPSYSPAPTEARHDGGQPETQLIKAEKKVIKKNIQ